MKIVMLAMIFLLFWGGNVLAQEQSQKLCDSADKVISKLQDVGYAPVWVGRNENNQPLYLVQQKKGDWMLLSFKPKDDEHPTGTICLENSGENSLYIPWHDNTKEQGIHT